MPAFLAVRPQAAVFLVASATTPLPDHSALDLLDDHQRLPIPADRGSACTLTYGECRHLIDSMGYGNSSAVFGNEKDDSFKGSLGNIFQSFGGRELYPTTLEKAANLLYMVTSNRAFQTETKRISAVFLYFLHKNNLLYRNGQKIIADHTLVAMVVMIAESKPDEKETMARLVINFPA